MSAVIHYSTTLESLTCGSCAIPFAIPSSLLASRKGDGGAFHCPNGCSISFRKTEADTLRERVKRLENAERWERDQREAAERSNKALRGVVTRKRKELARVKAGVCPCCNRTFQNLGRHMAGQHPTYGVTA